MSSIFTGKIGTIVIEVIAVVGTLLGVFIGYYLTIEPDFGMSIDPPQIYLNKGSDHNITIELYNIHDSRKYPYQIVLRLYNIDNFNLPPGISCTYDPPDPIAHPLANTDLVSAYINIHIDKNAISKEYPLRVLAFGADGKQKICPLMLTIP